MIDRRAIEAAFLYAGAVFAAGFVLGALRELWVAPLAGEFSAVTLEAPVMLAISWSVCGWTTERLDVSPRLLDRLVMGALALGLLIAAEAAVSVLAQGRDLGEYFASYSQIAVLLGLLAQLAFALFPMLRRRLGA